MVAMAVQYTMFSCGMKIGACALVFASGAYFYGIAISECIKMSLFAINENAKSKTNRCHLLEQIIEFLKLHSGAQQLSSTILIWKQPKLNQISHFEKFLE